MSTDKTSNVSRFERTLAYVLVALIAVSVIAFFAIMIATAAGMASADFNTPLWRAIAFTPWVGLPSAFLLVFVLILTGGRKRSATNSTAGTSR